jgi:hypothetical protein
VVPVDRVFLIVAHSSEEHTPGLRLLDNVFNNPRTPIIVFSIVQWISSHSQGIGGTENYTTVAANTVFLTTSHLVILGIIVIRIKGALVDTYLALDAPLGVSLY